MNKIKSGWLVVWALLALGQSTIVAAEDQAGTLWKVRTTGQLVFGFRSSAIPFSFVRTGSETPQGYSVELCQRLIEPIRQASGRDKIDVRWFNLEQHDRLPRVVSGEVDIECGITTVSSARSKQVAASSEIFKSEVRFLVRSTSGIQSLTDLNSRRIAFSAGATAEDVLISAENNAGLLIEHRAQKSDLEAFKAFDRGEADAWFVSEVAARTTLAQQQRSWSEFYFVGSPLASESYVIILRHKDPEIKALVDQTLKSLAEKGEMALLRAKWFEQSIDGLGYGLNYPALANPLIPQ